MLLSLEIKNFLMIEDIKISFKNAFTAITGETGAGKSIIVSAFLLVLGEKLSGKKVVRKGATNGTAITAFFDITNNSEAIKYINNLGIELTEGLILRRHIYEDGKSKFFINDILVSMQAITNFKEYILEVCGQHSSRSLLEKGNHLTMLDEYSGNSSYLNELTQLFNNLKNEDNYLKILIDKKEKSEIERDFLKSVVNDLINLNTFTNEEDELIEKRKNIAAQYKITEIVSKVTEHFSRLGYNKNLYSIEKDLEKCEDLFSKAILPLKNAISELKEFEAQLEDASSRYNDNLSMEQIENRLFKIRSLARKYSVAVAELPNLLVTKQMELDEIDSLDFLIKQANEKMHLSKQAYLKLAQQISSNRKLSAQKLKLKIESYLADLKMDKVGILINVEEYEEKNKWSAKGINKIEFLIRTNQGQNFTEIDKTASGGELSRIMLSIKLALSEKNSAEIIIFDEIDTGISGSVSSAVGKKLSELSKTTQVIAITHQPQVAAFADNHLHIAKIANDFDTKILINTLDDQESLKEIARMISGEKITEESLAAAKSLISESKID